MNDYQKHIDALMWEIHSEVEAQSLAALSGIGSDLAPLSVSYPPNESLTSEEKAALRTLNLSDEQRSGLRKLFSNATASAFFNTFCLMDGVSDPSQQSIDEWYGLRMQATHESDEDIGMLHDQFFGSWHDWNRKAKKS